MPWVAAWKVLVPVGAIAVAGILLTRPEGTAGKLSLPTAAHGSPVLGYLAAREMPDAIALLPPPPAPGSEAMNRDEQARTAALSLIGTSRYVLAGADANRGQPNTVAAFQCALGTEINDARTPALYRLLVKIRLDVRAAVYPAKFHFRRPRPFAAYDSHTCYPADEQNVRNDGSYPSARGAVGFAYAQVLAELNPSRAPEIAKRGEEFGRSRVVCDEEWLSDVEASRSIASVIMRHVEEKPAFRADFDAARAEVAAGLKSGAKPPNCPSEVLALASR